MEKSPFLMGKSTISMAIFNGYVLVYWRISWILQKWGKLDEIGIAILNKNMSHMSFSSQAQQRCAETAATQRSQGRITVKIPELIGTSWNVYRKNLTNLGVQKHGFLLRCSLKPIH